MPITYRIAENSFYWSVWYGTIDVKTLADYWTHILKVDEVNNLHKSLGDHRKASYSFNSTELWRLTDVHFDSKLNWCSAILVSEESQNMVKKWKFLTNSSVKSEIFFVEADALEWLRKQ